MKFTAPSREWLERMAAEEPDCGVLACSPELLKEMTMTTKVKIGLAQKHMPVVVDVLRSDGTVQYTQTLSELGHEAQEYVHSGQTLRVREMTTQEMHDAGLGA